LAGTDAAGLLGCLAGEGDLYLLQRDVVAREAKLGVHFARPPAGVIASDLHDAVPFLVTWLWHSLGDRAPAAKRPVYAPVPVAILVILHLTFLSCCCVLAGKPAVSAVVTVVRI
jgi:hypothetical protein